MTRIGSISRLKYALVPVAVLVGVAVANLGVGAAPAGENRRACDFLPVGVNGAVIDVLSLDDGASCRADLLVGERDGLPPDQTSFVGVFQIDIFPAEGNASSYDNLALAGADSGTGHIGAFREEPMGLGPTVDYLSVFCRGDYIASVGHQTMEPDAFPEDTALTRSITQAMASDIDHKLVDDGQSGCAFENTAVPARPGANRSDGGGGGVPWPPIVIGAGAAAAAATAVATRRRPASSASPAQPSPCTQLGAELEVLQGRYTQLQQLVAHRNNRLARVVEARRLVETARAQIAELEAALGVPNVGGTSSDLHTGISVSTGVGALRAESARQMAERAAERAALDGRLQRLFGGAAGAAPVVDDAAAVAAAGRAHGLGAASTVTGILGAIAGSAGLYNELTRHEQLAELGRKQVQVDALYQSIGREVAELEEQTAQVTELHDRLVGELNTWQQASISAGCPGPQLDFDQIESLGSLRTLVPGDPHGPVHAAVPLPTRPARTPSQSDLWDYDCGGLTAEIAAYHAELDASAAEDQRLVDELREWSSRRAALDVVAAELIEGWAEVEREFARLQSWWESAQATGQAANWGGVVAGFAAMPYLAIGLGVVSLAASLASSQVSPADAMRVLRARRQAAFGRVRRDRRQARRPTLPDQSHARPDTQTTRVPLWRDPGQEAALCPPARASGVRAGELPRSALAAVLVRDQWRLPKDDGPGAARRPAGRSAGRHTGSAGQPPGAAVAGDGAVVTPREGTQATATTGQEHRTAQDCTDTGDV